MAEAVMTESDGGQVDEVGTGDGVRTNDVGGAAPARRLHRPGAAPRTGEPWTDADYQQIVAAAQEGVTDMDEVARRVGRTRHPTLVKARRLLPVAERSAPIDRVMTMLREHLEDPAYDWRRASLENPIRPVYQPPPLMGLSGLTTDDLTQIGYALALAGQAVDRDVVERVGGELVRRGALGEVLTHRTQRLLRQPGAEITWSQATADAEAWVERVFAPEHGWVPWSASYYADHQPEPEPVGW
jgi:transposase-like protein